MCFPCTSICNPHTHTHTHARTHDPVQSTYHVHFLTVALFCHYATTAYSRSHLDDGRTTFERPLLRDAGSYLIMMVLLIIFFDDGVIHVKEAATLVILYLLGYLPIVAFSGKIRQWYGSTCSPLLSLQYAIRAHPATHPHVFLSLFFSPFFFPLFLRR